MSATRPKFTLVGSGLAGGLLATFLGRAGYDVELFERRSDPRAGNFVGGRSINLALSTRGIHALQQVGIAEEVLKNAIPMTGRMIHDRTGKLNLQPYDRDPKNYINSIGRAALNTAVIEAATRYPNVRVKFNYLCTEVDLDAPSAKLHCTDTNQTIGSTGNILIGVDGAFSAVRRSMQKLDRFDYDQSFLAHGYKELTIPPTADGQWRMEKNALHIWPRRSFMMIALPNPDGSFTCTLFQQFSGDRGLDALKSDDVVKRFFDEEFPDAVPLMPSLLEDFRTNPTGSLVTIRCWPWVYGGRVALLGDAAHAVVPFYGQGMNAAFEDCVVLDECLKQFAPDFSRALGEYQSRRKSHTDALARLAVANFIEMRDKTASRSHRWKKKLDHALEAVLPGRFIPLYGMVTFTRMGYAAAERRARVQDRVVFASIALIAILLIGLSIWIINA